MSSLDASKSAATIADYDAVAAAFDAGNKDHDVSQNIDALLGPIAAGRARGRSPPRATLGDAPGFARDPSSLRSKKARRRKPALVDH